MKVLFCASTLSHIKHFHIPYLRELNNRGYEIWVAANGVGDIPYAHHVVALPLQKKLWSVRNIRAIIDARKLLKEQKFDIVSTHTTLASAVIRFAILFTQKRPRVINTCHGFLFGENDLLKKWILLLPEKILAKVTNSLFVMNMEDYRIAQKYKLYNQDIKYVRGMGIDLSVFRPTTAEEKMKGRFNFGFTQEDFLYVYAAEFSKRKDHESLIKAFANVMDKLPSAKLLLAGDGDLINHCKSLVSQLGADNRILFLGYVKNMYSLYTICDVAVSSSKSEGLPFNIMESMACGLPVICSDIKGHTELVQSGENGLLYKKEGGQLSHCIVEIYRNQHMIEEFSRTGLKKIKKFQIKYVLPVIMDHYLDK